MVEYKVENHIALITLNSPETRNALNTAMKHGIVEAFHQAQDDDDVRCVVLTGAGKGFCAGVDLKELSENPELLSDDGPLLASFAHLKKPLIGALNGFAMTGGLELALACDFRYAAKTAMFADTHAVVGLMPTWGMSQKLPRLIGPSRAKEMSFTAKMVDADTALAWGLVDAVYDAEDLLPATFKTAETIVSNDQVAIMGIKKLYDEGLATTLEAGLKLEQQYSRPHNSAIEMKTIFEKLEAVKRRR